MMSLCLWCIVTKVIVYLRVNTNGNEYCLVTMPQVIASLINVKTKFQMSAQLQVRNWLHWLQWPFCQCNIVHEISPEVRTKEVQLWLISEAMKRNWINSLIFLASIWFVLNLSFEMLLSVLSFICFFLCSWEMKKNGTVTFIWCRLVAPAIKNECVYVCVRVCGWL